MKSNPAKAVVILIVLAVLGWWGYDSFSKRKAKRAYENQRVTRMNDNIRTLALHYDALTGWEDKLLNTERDVSSLEMDDALVNTGGKPILITMPIHDVARRGDKYFLYVHGSESAIRFALECDATVAKSVAKNSSAFPYYAIIARIVSVEKTDTRIKFQDAPEEDGSPTDEETPDLFFARGSCLDLVLTNDELPVPRK